MCRNLIFVVWRNISFLQPWLFFFFVALWEAHFKNPSLASSIWHAPQADGVQCTQFKTFLYLPAWTDLVSMCYDAFIRLGHGFMSYPKRHVFLCFSSPRRKILLLPKKNKKIIWHLRCFEWNTGRLLHPTHISDLIKGPDTGVCGLGKYMSVYQMWGSFGTLSTFLSCTPTLKDWFGFTVQLYKVSLLHKFQSFAFGDKGSC